MLNRQKRKKKTQEICLIQGKQYLLIVIMYNIGFNTLKIAVQNSNVFYFRNFECKTLISFRLV